MAPSGGASLTARNDADGKGAASREVEPDGNRCAIGQQRVEHLSHKIKGLRRLLGGGGRQQDLKACRPARGEVGEILDMAIGGRQHEAARTEDLYRIALRLEAAIALRTAALHHGADISVGADQAVRQRQVEVCRLAGRCDRAAEQAFVDVGADDGPFSGSVRRHHEVEQDARGMRAARQSSRVDGHGEIGTAENIGLCRRDAELIERHAIGRQLG